MASNTQTIGGGRVGIVAACCVFAIVVLNCSAAPLTSEKAIGKDETIIRHKDIENGNQEVLSSTKANVSAANSEPKPRTDEGRPKVVFNPVPGQLEKLLPATTHLEKVESNPLSDTSGQEASSSDTDFLQDGSDEEEVEEEEGGSEEPESDIYKRWQDVLADPRLQTVLENNEDRQRSDPRMIEEERLYSPELAEYLVRIGEADRAIDDLVNNGAMSPREAALYREAIEMEYGAPLQPVIGADMPPIVEVPEYSDNGEPLEDFYGGGANDYIFQSNPQQDYSSEYDQRPAPEQFIPRNEVEEREENEDQEDYLGSKEREDELLRELLGMMSLSGNEQGSALKSSSSGGSHQRPIPSLPASHQPLPPPSAVVKELEALPVKTKIGKTPEMSGTEEEKQLEEVRNRKTKQDNRTKSAGKGKQKS